MSDKIFQWCVDLLEFMADKLNISYQKLNVILFVVIMPIVFIVLLVLLFNKCG